MRPDITPSNRIRFTTTCNAPTIRGIVVRVCCGPTTHLFLSTTTLCLLAACTNSAAEVTRAEPEREITPPPSFSYVTPALVTMPRPGALRPAYLDWDFLASEVDLVVSLLPEHRSTSDSELAIVHIPIKDFQAPTLSQLHAFVLIVQAFADSNRRVAVFCSAGLGRSGTMAAAYLISHGMTADATVAKIRRLRPGSVESDLQMQALNDFEASLH